jgi:hypothetical protein
MAPDNQDPAPYLAMRAAGATPDEIYRRALASGANRSSCQILLMGVFDFSLDEARRVTHRVWEEDGPP